MKTAAIACAATMMVLATAGWCFAFHEGGVAACDGCHTMHNSSGGQPMTSKGLPVGSGNAYLLMGSDSSSTCLLCHASSLATDGYRVATSPVPPQGSPPLQLTPGGDFAYLQKSYSWVNSVTGQTVTSPGDAHGHNIVAGDFFYFQDSTNTTAPGGVYPSAKLGCISCHDPHGGYRLTSATAGTVEKPTPGNKSKPIWSSGSYGALPTSTEAVGVYRMLGGIGYAPKSFPNDPFVNDPPVAVSPAIYNRQESASATRVAYGRGMSEWCENCHGSLQHASYPNATVGNHPYGNAAKLSQTTVDTYNAYIATGNLTGTFTTAYNSLVPFEEGITDLSALAADTTATTGAALSDNVTCLTCHRAHASAWDYATRWNAAKGVYLTVGGSYPGIDAIGTGTTGEYATGKTQAEYAKTMYDRPASVFASNQWSLCNKCHENDQYKQ